MRPSIERVNEQLDPRQQLANTIAPINHTRPLPRKHSPDGTTKVGIKLQLTTHLSTLTYLVVVLLLMCSASECYKL